MRSTFKILFYLKKNNVKKTGYAPLMVRITINGVPAPFSLKAEAKPDDWDVKAGRVAGRTKEANTLNAFLDDVRSKIRRHYNELCEKESSVTAEMIRDAFLGLNVRKDTLLCLFDKHNEDYKTLVGGQTTEGTYKKYVNTRTRLSQYLLLKKCEDIALRDITLQFVKGFELYLFVNCKYERNTVMKCMQQFKRVITVAHDNGWIATNPFAGYMFHFEPTDRGYLTEKELVTFMQHSTECPIMEQARDVFVFCCFTGLSYIDLKNLTKDNIKCSFDGQMWVMTSRQKTKVQSNVRLLSIPQQILDKYAGKCGERILPIPENSTGNKRLKAIGKECGIATKVTFHLARHTFATTVTLGKGVPIESVSKMLGHKSVKTTQIYARIVDSKVSQDMEALSQKMGQLEQLYEKTQSAC